ncbi:gamma-glutamyl cyclotransferase [Halostagnicola larsenii XH-48]|uniref:Gamma-glutamyl cyclotransferase n=1 Tax=Halostagnicola larsenii XH-48 TaxID=797299 RepID=W0JSC3_9EURY|nr:gamma-glutamylcyclotransferase family protein [Halostagnicola larsenii]AHG00192.1 gamma-glutamyl cyclotransferase [Halostagnicola larsenii XH-48]
MLVFVYGTLTDAARVENVLDETGREPGSTDNARAFDAAFVGDATLEGLHRVDGAYPTLVPGGCVTGRVLSIDESHLGALDAYEGLAQGLYVRAGLPRIQRGESPATSPVDDFEVAVYDEPGTVPAQGPDLESIVWTYIGDPDRLGIEPEREIEAYWPGSSPFRERVHRFLNRNRIVVLIGE